MTYSFDVQAWFAEYEGGSPVGRPTILAAFASAIAPVLPEYQYFKSRTQFEFSFPTGTSYLKLERSKGIVSMLFGVTHGDVEGARRELFGERNPRIPKSPQTVSKWSLSMFPIAAGWASPHRAQWPIFYEDGLTKACAEAADLVSEVVKPYLVANEEPARIRETFLANGRSDGVPTLETLFAIDYLLHRGDWLEEDFKRALEEGSGQPSDLALYRSHYAAVISRWSDRG